MDSKNSKYILYYGAKDFEEKEIIMKNGFQNINDGQIGVYLYANPKDLIKIGYNEEYIVKCMVKVNKIGYMPLMCQKYDENVDAYVNNVKNPQCFIVFNNLNIST